MENSERDVEESGEVASANLQALQDQNKMGISEAHDDVGVANDTVACEDDWDDFGDFEASEALQEDLSQQNVIENPMLSQAPSSSSEGVALGAVVMDSDRTGKPFDRMQYFKEAVTAFEAFQPKIDSVLDIEKLPKLNELKQKFPELVLDIKSQMATMEEPSSFKGSRMESRILQRLKLIPASDEMATRSSPESIEPSQNGDSLNIRPNGTENTVEQSKSSSQATIDNDKNNHVIEETFLKLDLESSDNILEGIGSSHDNTNSANLASANQMSSMNDDLEVIHKDLSSLNFTEPTEISVVAPSSHSDALI